MAIAVDPASGSVGDPYQIDVAAARHRLYVITEAVCRRTVPGCGDRRAVRTPTAAGQFTRAAVIGADLSDRMWVTQCSLLRRQRRQSVRQ
jgi:hypothetical protein